MCSCVCGLCWMYLSGLTTAMVAGPPGYIPLRSVRMPVFLDELLGGYSRFLLSYTGCNCNGQAMLATPSQVKSRRDWSCNARAGSLAVATPCPAQCPCPSFGISANSISRFPVQLSSRNAIRQLPCPSIGSSCLKVMPLARSSAIA